MLRDYGRSGLFGSLIQLFRDGAHLERTLLTLGTLDLSYLLIVVLALSVTPWSQMPFWTRMGDIAALAFGVADLALALYCDLERPIWRALARGIVGLNLVGVVLLTFLD